MNITQARVHWYEGVGNAPTVVALVDRLVGDAELRFRVFPDYVGQSFNQRTGPLYVAVKDGLVVPWWHDPKNENGCAGGIFTFAMEDGSEARVKGPWRYPYTDGVQRLWGTRPHECFLTDSEEAFFTLEAPESWRPRGVRKHHMLRLEYVTHEFWMEAVERSGCWLAEVTRVHGFNKPITWIEPTMERSPPKNVGTGDSWRYVYPAAAVERWGGGCIAPLPSPECAEGREHEMAQGES